MIKYNHFKNNFHNLVLHFQLKISNKNKLVHKIAYLNKI